MISSPRTPRLKRFKSEAVYRTQTEHVREQLEQFGGQYLGPLEEDNWWHLLFFRKYTSVAPTKEKRMITRYKLVQAAAKASEHQVTLAPRLFLWNRQ